MIEKPQLKLSLQHINVDDAAISKNIILLAKIKEPVCNITKWNATAVHFALPRECSEWIVEVRVTSGEIVNDDWLGAGLGSGGSKTVRLKQASLVYLNFFECEHAVIYWVIITCKFKHFHNSKVVSYIKTSELSAVKISFPYECFFLVKSVIEFGIF